jgi:hypothetical protein
MPDSFSLIAYDAACAAVAEARRVDEVKGILDKSAAMKEYARRANNHQLEEDAAEIRVRATRKLGELIKAQKGGDRGRARQIPRHQRDQ